MTFTIDIADRLDPASLVELWHDASTSNVFNHPAWWEAAIAAWGAGRPLHVVTARAGERLVAAWPFWRKRLGSRDGLAGIMEPVASRHSDYVMPLVRRGCDVEDLTAAMLRALRPHIGAHAMLFWPKSPQPDESRRAVERACTGGLWQLASEEMPTAYLALARTRAETEIHWKSRHRRELRRQHRRLAEQGAVTLEVAGSRDEAAGMLRDLVAMHRANWAARGGRSEFEDPRAIHFLDGILAGLPWDRLHLSALRCADRRISVQLGFVEAGALMLYKPAFDIGMAVYSPGKLHDDVLVDWSMTRQLSRIDFMQGLESYKLLWTSAQRPTSAFAAAPPAGLLAFHWNVTCRKLVIRYRE